MLEETESEFKLRQFISAVAHRYRRLEVTDHEDVMREGNGCEHVANKVII